MANAPVICANCNLEITTARDGAPQFKDNKQYHRNCLINMEIDERLAVVNERYPTTDAKLARMITQLNTLSDDSTKQKNSLNTIKNILIIFMVLVILAAILQSCAAF